MRSSNLSHNAQALETLFVQQRWLEKQAAYHAEIIERNTT
jgi:hypothetical protein